MNVKPRTMFTGDNLDILRGFNSASVDLIYLDPPFNSNHNYAAPIGSQAAGAEFRDTWTLDDIDVAWHGLIADKNPGLGDIIKASLTPSIRAYLIYMAVRLVEMERVLKGAGSIYLHCDPTMSHWLKVTMDAIFGHQNFRNEIVWKRTSAHSDASTMGSVHDVLLYYTNGDQFTFNSKFLPYAPEYVESRYRNQDSDGRRWTDGDLTAKGLTGGGYDYEYKGVKSEWRVPPERMAQLDEENRLHFTRAGGIRIKRYLDEMKGLPISDVWTDVSPINSQANERIGYPTQKPLALLERIVKASSDPGDVVLDPFCGCATTCIAAEKLGRNWIGIDISEKANELVRERLAADQNLLSTSVIHRTDIPRRTDVGHVPAPRENKHHLYGVQEGKCNGCGVHMEYRHLEIDHVIPVSKGGTDHLENLQLLCGHCNRRKGNRTQAEFLAEFTRE